MATRCLPKVHVFKKLFETTGFGMVMLADLTQAIEETNKELKTNLSTRNVANFFKDYTRKNAAANKNWPLSGVSARKGQDKGQCFEFVSWPKDQEPFQDTIKPSSRTKYERVSHHAFVIGPSRDESYVAKLAEDIGLYDAFCQTINVKEVKVHQYGKKGRAEIDVLLTGKSPTGQLVLVAVEVKNYAETITMDQLLCQATECTKLSTAWGIPNYYMVAMKPVRTDNNGTGIFMTSSQELSSSLPVVSLEFSDGVLYDLNDPIPPIVGRR